MPGIAIRHSATNIRRASRNAACRWLLDEWEEGGRVCVCVCARACVRVVGGWGGGGGGLCGEKGGREIGQSGMEGVGRRQASVVPLLTAHRGR